MVRQEGKKGDLGQRWETQKGRKEYVILLPKDRWFQLRAACSPVDGHWSGCISSASKGVKVPRRGDRG